MNRRQLLVAGSTAGTVAIAGCTSLFTRKSEPSIPPVIDDRPDSVYFPTHAEGMEMIGMVSAGDYTIGLMYSYPHRFWTVTGATTERISIQDDDDVHLMASVWDDETNTVLPVDSGLSMAIDQDGETVTRKTPWPMISQNMGFHYGDNFSLEGDGSYSVTFDIGGMNISRLGAFDGKFQDSVSGTVEFDYSRDERDDLPYETFEDEKGNANAVELMEMETVPVSVTPEPDVLPGTHITTETADNAVFQVIAIDDPSFIDGSGTYLAVTLHTPHNRIPLPMMSLSGTAERDSVTVFDDTLSTAIHPDIGYHYGAVLDGLESGTRVMLTVDTAPQISRHEGYETAFFELPPVEFTVP